MTILTPPPSHPGPHPTATVSDGGDGSPAEVPGRTPRKGPALVLAMLGVATVGFSDIRLAGWTLSDALFVMTAGVVITQLLTGRTRGIAPASMRHSPGLLLVGSIVMLSAGTLSSLWSYDPGTSMSVVVRYGWLTLAWFWILRSVVPNRAALVALVQWLRAGLMISSVAAVLGYLGIIHNAANLSGRQAGFFSHANGLAGYLVMGLPLFLLGVPTTWTDPPKSIVRTRLIPSAIVVLALATTGSITAALAAIVGAGTAGLLLLTKGRGRRRQRNPLRNMVVMLVIVVALLALARSGTQLVERFTEFTEGRSAVHASASYRERGASFVIGQFDENLVLGVGFDRETAGIDITVGDQSYGAGGSGIHNMIFKMYYEGGAITLFGFLLILFGTLQLGWHVIRATIGDDLQNLAIALVASVVSLNVLAQFQPMGFERFYWLPVALIGVVWAVRRQELQEMREAREASEAAGVPATNGSNGRNGRNGMYGVNGTR